MTQPEGHLSQSGHSSKVYFLVSILSFLPALFSAVRYFIQARKKRSEPVGCSKHGIHTKSNLSDEHNKRYLEGSQQNRDPTGADLWRVKSLWVYPIKSCRGVELEQGTIITTGMQYDRLFSFAQLLGKFPAASDSSDPGKSDYKWRFLTQRERPLLACVRTEIWLPDTSSPNYSRDHPNVQSEGVLVIKFPLVHGFWGWFSPIWVRLGGSEFQQLFQVPLNPTEEQIKGNGYTTDNMTIWKDNPESLIMASTGPSENNPILKDLSRFLSISNSFALFRVPRTPIREIYRCAPRKEQLGYQTRIGFQDAYPLHIQNLASIRNVETRLLGGTPKLSALQFRSNIVVTGPEAYNEDNWKMIRIGDFKYHVCCRTARCIIPNTNQDTGVKHKAEPFTTLRSFRAIDPGAGKSACLGMQMVPALQHGLVKIGDSIEVLETGEHYYVKQ